MASKPKAVKKVAGINEKQKRFVEEYLKDTNGKQAAIRAGYAANSADVHAARMLANASVKEYLAARREKLQNKMEITQERVLKELARIAFFDSGKLFDDAGEPVPLSCMDEDTRRAIVGVEMVTKGNDTMGYGEVQKIRLADKKGALDSLSRHLGLFNDKLELNVNKDLADRIAEARARKK